MSNQLEDDFKLIINLLKQSFTSSNKENHSEIIKQLQELYESNPIAHFQLLMKGLTLDNNQVPLDVKKSIAIYINNLLQSHREKLGNKALLELLNFIIQATIYNENIAPIVPFFNKGILFIISAICLMQNSSYLKEVFDYLQFAVSKSSSDNLSKQALKVMEIITVFIKSGTISCDTITLISPQIFTIVDSIFSSVPNFISNSKGITIEFVKLLKELYNFFVQLAKRFKADKKPASHYLSLFEKYGLYTWELINLNIDNKGNNAIIYMNNDEQLDNQVNQMKARAIYFLILLINGNGKKLSDNNLIVYVSKCINVFIQSLDALIKTNFQFIQTLRNLTLSDGFNAIIYYMILFFNRTLIKNPIQEEFTPLINNFIINIIFPFLLSSPKDVDEIEVDGEAYFNYVFDLAHSNEIKTVRNAVCSLLLKICDYYPYVSDLIINFLCKYFMSLLSENKSDLNNNQFAMQLDINSPLLTLDLEYKIDFCLFVLVLLENFVSESKTFKTTLRSLLLQYNAKLHSINSILVSDKLCLFYGEYLTTLFGQEISTVSYEFCTLVLNYLMQILLNCDKYEGLGYQSSNAIYNLLKEFEEENQFVIPDIFNQNITKINALIDESDVPFFFSILIFIAESVDFTSQENQFDFISRIVKRMNKAVLDSIKHPTIPFILNDGFDILNKMLSRCQLTNDPNIKLNISSFEAIVTPLVSYIKNPQRIKFEDYIIDLMKNEIIAAQTIPPLPLSIVPMLQLTCKKNKQFSETELDFLITFIKYDPQGEFTAQYINELTFLIYQGYQLEHVTPPKSVALFSLVLIAGNNALSNDNPALLTLLTKTCEIIENLNQHFNYSTIGNQNKSKNVVDYELSLLTCFSVICTAMITKPFETLDCLIKTNSFKAFIDFLPNLIRLKICSTKIMKQILLGLSSIVHNPQSKEQLIQLKQLFTVLKIIIYLTGKQKQNDLVFMKRMVNKEINCNFVEDNQEEEDEDDMDLNDEETKNYLEKYAKAKDNNDIDNNTIVRRMNFRNDQIDEYATFAECLQALGNELLMQFGLELNDNEKYMLTELCLLKKVDVMYHQKLISVPRKTVKIKRKNKEQGNESNSNNNNINTMGVNNQGKENN